MSDKTITFRIPYSEIPLAKRRRFGLANACAEAARGLAEAELNYPTEDGDPAFTELFPAGQFRGVQQKLQDLHRHHSPKFEEVTLSNGDGEIDLHVFEDGTVTVAGIRGAAPRSKAGIRIWINRRYWNPNGVVIWAVVILSKLAKQ